LQNSTAWPGIRRLEDDDLSSTAEAFTNPEFLRAEAVPLADGRAARMIITHDVDPLPPRYFAHRCHQTRSARAIKGTPCGSKIYLAGMRPPTRHPGRRQYDLMIAAIAAMSLILLIMMFITRSVVAAFVIVAPLRCRGRLFRLRMIWQDILGIELYGSCWRWRSSCYWPLGRTTTCC